MVRTGRPLQRSVAVAEEVSSFPPPLFKYPRVSRGEFVSHSAVPTRGARRLRALKRQQQLVQQLFLLALVCELLAFLLLLLT